MQTQFGLLLNAIFSAIVICNEEASAYASTLYHPVQHELKRSEKLISPGILTLNWKLLDNVTIIFEVIANSKGFIALGFSYPDDKHRDTDIVLIWVDDNSKKPNILVRYEAFLSIVEYNVYV